VAVGTPGRIIDLIETSGSLDLSQIRCVPHAPHPLCDVSVTCAWPALTESCTSLRP